MVFDKDISERQKLTKKRLLKNLCTVKKKGRLKIHMKSCFIASSDYKIGNPKGINR